MTWRLRKPAGDDLEALRMSQSRFDVTYTEVGRSDGEPPPGFHLDHNRIELGRGREAFDAGCAALRNWRQFQTGWTEVHPPALPLERGNVVVVLARAFGLWWPNCSRIVYTIDEDRRFGFAYGTLPGHVECGEERFSIEWDAADRVWYDLRAFSRPRYWGARVAFPLTRRLQQRFARCSLEAMRNAVAKE